MQHTLTEFQDLNVIESGRIRITANAIDLHTLVSQVVQSNAYYAQQKEHSLHLELAPGLPPVQADEPRLHQVIDNLIGNAIKFSPYQATTVVRTRLEPDSVVFEVQDTGPGLTEQDLEKVFVTKFAQLSNLPTGSETHTGLGLTLCKHLIDLQGGDIGVYNNPTGQGATFWFRLPLGTAA
jgi:signal transduction histidine kinase